jgi:hypothetical protein
MQKSLVATEAMFLTMRELPFIHVFYCLFLTLDICLISDSSKVLQ